VATKWFLDSGSSDHITNNSAIFSTQEVAFTDESVVSGTGSAEIQARGRVEISVNTPNGRNSATIDGVLLCPGYATNVISLSKLLDKGFDVDFRACTITKAGATIMLFKREGAMWVVSNNIVFPDPDASHVTASERVIATYASSPSHIKPVGRPQTSSQSFITKAHRSALQKPILKLDIR
jgi:hypothetical protein